MAGPTLTKANSAANAKEKGPLASAERDGGAKNEKMYEAILDKLHKKGWNAYEEVFKTDSDITAGPATKISPHSNYVVLPAVREPTNLDMIFEKLDEIAVSRGRKMPTITIGGEAHAWTGFVMRGSDVKVKTREGTVISCSEFVDALDTILKV